MSLHQEFDGREHSPSGSNVSTDVHGDLGTIISMGAVGNKVTTKGVDCLGSVWEVAWGQPEGKLPTVEMKIRLSGVLDFEAALYQANPNVPAGTPISAAAPSLTFTLTSEPLDGNEDALPVVTTTFTAQYLGGEYGMDRSNNDPLVFTATLQQTSPATRS